MLRPTLLCSFALLVGCGDGASPQNVAPDDVLSFEDTSDLGVDAPLDSPDGAEVSVVDAPADASRDDAYDAVVDADAPADVSDDAAMLDDGGPSCARDSECVGCGERGVCDTTVGRCVECLSARDLCPSDQHCDDATHTCVEGCRSDEGCVGAMRLHCDPTAHACVTCARDEHCPSGQLCIGRACMVGCSTSRPCPLGNACCAGGCADLQMSLLHCGRCEAPCAPANAEARCAGGACGIARCLDGFADCDGDLTNGCEVDVRASVAHCGSCTTVCPNGPRATAMCVRGACEQRCEETFGDCDGSPFNGCETALSTTLANCGRCGRACGSANATAQCAAGVCSLRRCNPGFTDCDGEAATGCEVNTALDPNQCGTCGNRCPTPPMASAVCVSGTCGASNCATGFGNCDGNVANGCEQSLVSDVNHCGACGLRCAPAANATVACTASRCDVSACNAGFANCDGLAPNGCEADLSSTTSCGACGNRCDTNLVCNAGTCAYPALRFVLSWSGTGDFDLRVRTPGGVDLWSGNPMADGGSLDTNARTPPGPETIAWSGSPARGLYNVCVSATGAFLRFSTFTVRVYRGATLAATYSGSRFGTTSSTTCLTSASTYVNRFSY